MDACSTAQELESSPLTDEEAKLLVGVPTHTPPLPYIYKSSMVCTILGCGRLLADHKAFFQRHKLCEDHAHAPVLNVNGRAQRLCQQCSAFHPLTAFSGTKRTCNGQLTRIKAQKEARRKAQRAAAADGTTIQDTSGTLLARVTPASPMLGGIYVGTASASAAQAGASGGSGSAANGQRLSSPDHTTQHGMQSGTGSHSRKRACPEPDHHDASGGGGGAHGADDARLQRPRPTDGQEPKAVNTRHPSPPIPQGHTASYAGRAVKAPAASRAQEQQQRQQQQLEAAQPETVSAAARKMVLLDPWADLLVQSGPASLWHRAGDASASASAAAADVRTPQAGSALQAAMAVKGKAASAQISSVGAACALDTGLLADMLAETAAVQVLGGAHGNGHALPAMHHLLQAQPGQQLQQSQVQLLLQQGHLQPGQVQSFQPQQQGRMQQGQAAQRPVLMQASQALQLLAQVQGMQVAQPSMHASLQTTMLPHSQAGQQMLQAVRMGGQMQHGIMSPRSMQQGIPQSICALQQMTLSASDLHMLQMGMQGAPLVLAQRPQVAMPGNGCLPTHDILTDGLSANGMPAGSTSIQASDSLAGRYPMFAQMLTAFPQARASASQVQCGNGASRTQSRSAASDGQDTSHTSLPAVKVTINHTLPARSDDRGCAGNGQGPSTYVATAAAAAGQGAGTTCSSGSGIAKQAADLAMLAAVAAMKEKQQEHVAARPVASSVRSDPWVNSGCGAMASAAQAGMHHQAEENENVGLAGATWQVLPGLDVQVAVGQQPAAGLVNLAGLTGGAGLAGSSRAALMQELQQLLQLAEQEQKDQPASEQQKQLLALFQAQAQQLVVEQQLRELTQPQAQQQQQQATAVSQVMQQPRVIVIPRQHAGEGMRGIQDTKELLQLLASQQQLAAGSTPVHVWSLPEDAQKAMQTLNGAGASNDVELALPKIDGKLSRVVQAPETGGILQLQLQPFQKVLIVTLPV